MSRLRQSGDDNFAKVATLAANNGMTTFKDLKQYRLDMKKLWQAYNDASLYYSVFLMSPPLLVAYQAANARLKKIKEAKGAYARSPDKTDESNLVLMDMSDHYRRFATWYYGELQKYRAVTKQLGKQEHAEVITEVLEQAKKDINT